MNDVSFMQRALELARLGHGHVSPNPMVGAVLVKKGKIIGEGHHQKYGGPHAEVHCFDSCTESPEGATLYVTLEPCCHTHKQTPPCAPLVISKKIKKIIICNIDPNPNVAGQGIKLLQAAGIEVETGLLADQGEELNEIFFHYMRSQTPFIHLKAALTLDGKIALKKGESKWITNEKSREDVHFQRAGYSAIVVGAETIRQDNPSLTVRHLSFPSHKQPYRIVITKSGELPPSANIFTDAYKDRTLIYISGDTFSFHDFYIFLSSYKITSLWVEGGGQIFSLFLREQQAHRLTLYMAPKIMGQGKDFLPRISHSKMKDLPSLKSTQITRFDDDTKISGRLSYSNE